MGKNYADKTLFFKIFLGFNIADGYASKFLS